MARPRLSLHSYLQQIAENVYYQAPPNTQMQYPCLLYSRDGVSTQHADNELYRHAKRYQLTVIDRNPDSTLQDLVEELPLCAFQRFFTADGLNHWVFTLYF